MRGHKLLKDKRDELMRQFLDLVRENKALRQKVEAGIAVRPTRILCWPRPPCREETLDAALMCPKQEVESGCQQPERHERGCAGLRLSDPNAPMRTTSIPMALPLPPAIWTTRCSRLAEILPDMLRLAEVEKSCQLMAAEIEKTRRRVNALEHVMIPQTAGESSSISP